MEYYLSTPRIEYKNFKLLQKRTKYKTFHFPATKLSNVAVNAKVRCLKMQLSKIPNKDTLYRRPNQLRRLVLLTSQHVKFHSKDPDDTEDESDTDEAKVRYILISSRRYSDASVAQVGSVDLSDISLRLGQLYKEEMAKVEWEPEYRCGPCTCTASTENIIIYFDDSTSEGFEGVEPIFMQTSGLGMNTAMLDECCAGRGPRPQKGLDLLAGLRKGRSQSAEYSK